MDSLESFRSTDPGEDKAAKLHRVQQAIGWTSLGVGLAEMVAPGTVGKIFGLEDRTRSTVALRAIAAGNLASGLGILMRPRRAAPMWFRVAADAAGFGLLVAAGAGKRTSTIRLFAALIGAGAGLAFEAYTSQQITRAQEAQAPQVIFSVTINKTPTEVYTYFRKLENLPHFMDFLESVTETDATHSHWVAKLPLVGTVTWDAELTEDRPGELLAWQSTKSTLFAHRGSVAFARAPGRDSTEVRVMMEASVPGIAPSATLAKLFTKPQIKGDLRRLKQILETGEVLISDASAHKGKHPAQPSASATAFAHERAPEIAAAARKLPPRPQTATSTNSPSEQATADLTKPQPETGAIS